MTKTSAQAVTHALAVCIRDLETGNVRGVALIVASERFLAFLAEGATLAAMPTLSAETWREIEAWGDAGDAGLPVKPAPMSPSIVATFAGDERQPATGERFASIPIVVSSREELTQLTGKLLPDLLRARRS